jgi:hypothetical protein
MEVKEQTTNQKAIKEKIVIDFIDKYKNEPKQQSAEWHAKRAKTVGGSELNTLITNMAEFVAGKIGLRGHFSGMPTVWGQVMEQVARRYLELVYKCNIYEASSLPSAQVSGKSYSPDGIGVANVSSDATVELYKIILFEIKCVFSRVLKKGVVYKPYIPQIMSGMCDIPIIDQGIYAEFVFKLCSVKSLTTNPYYTKSEAKEAFGFDNLGINEEFHNKSDDYFDNKPIATGCLMINIDKETFTEVSPILTSMCKYDGKSVLDVGSQTDENTICNLFQLIKYYDLDTRVFLELNDNDPDAFVSKLGDWTSSISNENKTKGSRKLMIIPFKLMDTNVVNVKKQDNYTLGFKDLINEALGIVDQLVKITNIDERREAWKIRFNKKK